MTSLNPERKYQILLVDSDEDELTAIKKRMRYSALKPGFEVERCASAEDALEKLKGGYEKYLTVLLHFQLFRGGISGDELLETLRSQYPDLPVIVFTGKDHFGPIKKFAEGGILATMTRPLDYGELEYILGSISEGEHLLWRMVNDVNKLLERAGSNECMVWKYDRKSGNYRVAYWTEGVGAGFRKEGKLKRTSTKWRDFYIDGRPRLFADLLKKEPFPEFQFWGEVKEQGWNGLISIPLFYKERLIGFIDCYSQGGFIFQEGHWENMVSSALSAFGTQASESLRGASLSKQAQTIREINQAFSGTLNEEYTLSSILSKGMELSGADYGWIYVSKRSPKSLKLKICKGLSQDWLRNELLLDKESVTGWVADKGVLVHLEDVRKPSPSDPHYLEIPEVAIKSIVAVPIRRGKATIGVIAISSKKTRYFTDDDMGFFISLAAIAGVAMEQAKLTEYLHQANDMAMQSDYKSLVEYVVEAVHELTGADVNFWEPSKREGEGNGFMRISEGGSKGEWTEEYLNSVLPIGTGKGVIAKALQKGGPIKVDNIENDPDFIFKDVALKFGRLSYMAIPLIGKDEEVIGAISLYSHMYNMFSSEDEELMGTFAKQIAHAFQQQRRMKTVQKLAEAGMELKLNATQDDPYHKIVQIAQEISEADCVMLYPYDPVRSEFFDLKKIAAIGLKGDKPQFADKPRKDKGFLSIVNKHGFLIVDDVQKLELRKYTEKDGAILFNEEEKKEASEQKKHDSSVDRFVAHENLKSFVGISLRVPDAGEERRYIELGVLYFNYRYLHRFDTEELKNMQIFANYLTNVLHVNWEAEKVKNNSTELSAIYDSGVAIFEKEGQRDRFSKIVENATKLIKAEGGAIYLAEHGRLELTARTKQGAEVLDKKRRISFGEGLVGRIFKNGRPEVVSDYSNYEYAFEEMKPSISAMMGVPLKVGKKVIGVLIVFETKDNEKTTREFTLDHKRLLERFAQQASLAIYYARLNKELKTLYKASLAIPGRFEIDKVGDTILEELKQVVKYDRAAFQLIHGYEQKRELIAHKGKGKFGSNDFLIRPVVEDPLLLEIFTKIEGTRVIPDTQSKRISKWKVTQETKDVKSWAGIPLFYQGRAIGLITLDGKVTGYFQHEDRKILDSFANQAAIAVYHVRILEGLKKLQESGGMLTSGKIKDEDAFQAALESIANNIKSLFYAGSVTIFPYSLKEINEKMTREFGKGVRVGWGEDGIAPPSPEGAATKIINNKEPARFFSKKEAELEPANVIQGKRSVSYAHIPLTVEKEYVGVLFINYYEDHVFFENEKELMKLFAQQAALAVESAADSMVLHARLLNAEKYLLENQFKAKYIHRIINQAGTIPFRVGQIREKLKGKQGLKMIDPYLKGILDDAYGMYPIDHGADAENQVFDVVECLQITYRRALFEAPAYIKLEKDIAIGSAKVDGKENDLIEALWNITKNAIQAIDNKPRKKIERIIFYLTRESSLDSSQIVIKIKNSGPLIPEENLNKIGSLFFSTRDEGTGYGFWRARVVVQQLKGRLIIENEQGSPFKGVVVTLTIPEYYER